MAKQKTYRHLRGKIAPFTEEPSYQQLVDEKKQEIIGPAENGEDANINMLAAKLVEKSRAKKALYERYGSKTNDTEYELNLYIKALSQLFASACMAQGAEEVRLSTGELVGLDDKAILNIKDKPVAIEWLLANMPELLTVSYKGLNAVQIRKLSEWGAKHKLAIECTLDSNTLKALGRDNAKQGKPTPPGMELTLLTQASVYGLNRNGAQDDE